MDNDKLIISYSKLRGFKSCPRRYEFMMNSNIVETKKPWATGGKAWHKVMERLAGTQNYKRSDLLAIFEGEWKRAALNNFWNKREENMVHKYYVGKALVTRVYELLQNFNDKNIIIKEMAFVVDVGNIKINGVIDIFVDGDIYDYKFSKYRDHDLLQLYMYYRALTSVGIPVKNVGIINPMVGAIDKYSVEDIIRSEEDFFNKLMVSLSKDIKFEGNPSAKNCKDCGFRKRCPDHWRGTGMKLK